MMYVN